MKNIFKTFMAAILITGFASCEDEQDLIYVNPEASFEIISPQSGESVLLDPSSPNNPGLVLVWTPMEYGTPTEVTYTVQTRANGSEDENDWVDITTTTGTTITISSETLNNTAIDAGLPAFSESGLDVRIKATVGTGGSEPAYSNTIVYLVTPFTFVLPKMAVVGNHQGWNPAAEDVPLVAASGFGETDYEGYVWLDGAYKFLEPDADGNFAWGNTDYGDDGTFTGILAESGEVDATATAGYYKVTANTATLTYSATLTDWGVIGSATPGGWDNDTDMTYDAESRTWSVTMDLIGGQFMKFRANDEWAINMGDNATDGSLEQDGSDIPVAASGNYTITLDQSNPRAYTYTIQQN